MASSRTKFILAPWPKRIALFSYALLILLTITSGAVEFGWGSGTRPSSSNTSIGIESGRITFTRGFWYPTLVDFNYDGWKWWIDWRDWHSAGAPRQTYVAVPLWMLLVVVGVFGAALPVFLLRGHCHNCGYDLRGQPPGSRVCPECGKATRSAGPLNS
jgi:hypothetical protein